MIKPLMSSNDQDWSFIKEKLDLHYNPCLEYSDKVSMVICHFICKDNDKKGVDVDPRSLKPLKIF